MTYRPLHDNILVKLNKHEEKTKTGIFLPGASKEKPQIGTIVAIGEGKILENGTVRKMAVKIGDKVVFRSYAPTELPNEEELAVISEADVIAVVE